MDKKPPKKTGESDERAPRLSQDPTNSRDLRALRKTRSEKQDRKGVEKGVVSIVVSERARTKMKFRAN